MSRNPEVTPAGRPRWWVWWWRAVTVLALAGLTMLLAPTVRADPVDPATVPATLRQYVPDSAEWLSSPWMTADSCRDRGGDWSIYASYLIKDMPELLAFFQPTFAGQDSNAAARKELLVAGYRDVAANLTVPGGYCVDEVKRWATPNPQFQPFGFEWGNVDTWGEHGVRPYSSCSQNNPDSLAPCRGFYLACDGAVTQQDDQRCQAWNAFSDDYVKRMNTVLGKAYSQYGIVVDGRDQTKTVIKSPGEVAQEFLNWVAKKGMEQVVSFIVSGVTKLWGVFMRIAVDYTSPNVSGMAFASVYNLVAGIALALAFLGWLLTLATSWKRGHLQYALLGGVKAVAGVTLAGVGAILMVQLADDCTKSLVSAGGDIARQADFTTSLLKANPLVAILAGVLIAICLIFATIFLVINSGVVLMWALFGSIAAAGQVHPASAGWLGRWGARLTALAWAKFFMVAVMLLVQGLLLPLDAGEDPVKQVIDVLQGLVLCLLLVLCPWLLWELVDFVGDRVGGAAASGGVAGRLAATGTARAARVGGSATRAVGGAVGGAVAAMLSSSADVSRKFPGGTTGPGRGTGPSAGTGPGRGTGAGTSGPVSLPRPRTGASAGTGSRAESTVGDSRAATLPPAGSGGGAGTNDLPAPQPPANRGRVVASAPRPAPAARPPAGPDGGGSGPGEAPRMPPPA